MNKQVEIRDSRPLLDSRGYLKGEGWAREPYWNYSRGDIRASWLRIKEWDYYYVLSDELKRGITFTISDLGYAALMALCWVNLESGETFQVDTIVPLSKGCFFAGKEGKAPDSESGTLFFEDPKLMLRFETGGGRRSLIFRAPDLELGADGRGLEGEISLTQPGGMESINIATSWAENRRRFYYNRKINCMPAKGKVHTGSTVFDFRPDEAFAGLDWGRGAWTYRNRWFWSSASGMVDGKSFGFNLGYGFSDRSPASENILFSDGVGHKLGELRFEYDEADYTAPWRVLDSEGRLELEFIPIVDRFSSVNLVAIRSIQHQVFGRFSGTAVLDDGSSVQLRNFLGFAEDVYNRW